MFTCCSKKGRQYLVLVLAIASLVFLLNETIQKVLGTDTYVSTFIVFETFEEKLIKKLILVEIFLEWAQRLFPVLHLFQRVDSID